MENMFIGANKALEGSPHSMGQCTLIARKKKARVWEKNKILVEGISATTTKDGLMFYVERISDLEVKEITYGTRSNQTVNAIVTFHSSIGEFGGTLTRFCFPNPI